jgi:hypothetical protein
MSFAPSTATVFIYVLGAEGILLILIWGKGLLAQKQFLAYVKQEHPDFYAEHLDYPSPFRVGGLDAFLKQARAGIYALRGQMPDQRSSHYQRIYKKWMFLWFLGFLVFALTMLCLFLLSYFGIVP